MLIYHFSTFFFFIHLYISKRDVKIQSLDNLFASIATLKKITHLSLDLRYIILIIYIFRETPGSSIESLS